MRCNVTVVKTTYETIRLEVESDDLEEAKLKAIEESKEEEFSQVVDIEYWADEPEVLEEE